MHAGNLFANLPSDAGQEVFEALFETPSVKIERIVSTGQATPQGEWYDQERDEWVVLLRGSAGLRVEGEPEVRTLSPGDYVHLSAHLRHRVEWTSADEATVWLAVHFT